jgi:hypothetical protein
VEKAGGGKILYDYIHILDNQWDSLYAGNLSLGMV